MTVYVRAEDVSEEIVTRIQRIRIANGFETDIGRQILRGRVKVPADDMPPCTALIEGNDDTEDTAGKLRSAQIKVRVPFMIDGFDACDPDQPNVKAHAMIRDIKRAIFHDGRTLGEKVVEVSYLGRDIGPRPDGVGLVQVRVAIEVSYAEDLANP